MIATFFRVFPNGVLFSNDQYSQGYDAVLLGSNGPLKIDIDRLQNLLNRSEYAQVKDSLIEVGFGSGGPQTAYWDWDVAINLFSTYAGQARDLQSWTARAQINRDKDLRLQYLAGMGFNSFIGTKIFQDILAYYRFPETVYTGSSESILTLRQALANGGRR